MSFVRPKKKLGQHFLKDQNIARKIVDSLDSGIRDVLEIGPGMGILTRFLLQRPDLRVFVIELDIESVFYLQNNYPEIKKIWHEDFLKADLKGKFQDDFSVIGNFPYNISSQIFFKVIEHRNQVQELVCMVQKEVAERITAKNGNKTYGILSVLIQTFYNTEYLFTVSEKVFIPPPKVKSAVIRLKRNKLEKLPCNEDLFQNVVKSAFGHRRKMLRNSLQPFCKNLPEEFAERRPEQLAIQDFIDLTSTIENLKKN